MTCTPPELLAEPSAQPSPEATFDVVPERTAEALATVSVAPDVVADDAPVASPATAKAVAEGTGV